MCLKAIKCVYGPQCIICLSAGSKRHYSNGAAEEKVSLTKSVLCALTYLGWCVHWFEAYATIHIFELGQTIDGLYSEHYKSAICAWLLSTKTGVSVC